MPDYFSTFSTSIKRWFIGQKSDLKAVHIDQILNNTTCQPISLQDFRYYLLNKEHSAENLDFYFWYLSYKRRFQSLPEEEQLKSQSPKERATPNSYNLPLDDLKKEGVKPNPAQGFDQHSVPTELEYVSEKGQPFRSEVDAVLRTFFHTDSFKELNIEGWMNRHAVYYGCQTTHPDVFIDVHEHIYDIMRRSSLKNFIHHALQNMRYSWVIFHYVGGFFNFLHLPAILLYTFSNHTTRWLRLLLFPFTFLFAVSILSGRAGFCTLRAAMKIRMVPIYEIDEYEILGEGKTEKLNGKKLDIENQKSMVTVIDPEVLKYSKEMFFHIWFVGTLLSLIVTIAGVAVTNENEPMPMQ
ncbi:hypothetical protein BDF21DRAFT_453615 [Thamnidium elegans]|nr:hypothetical protein BDF21DRAFT_453615 [Thamnidium elegans]